MEVVDIDSEKPVGRIQGMNGVHGVALAPILKIDAKEMKVLAQWPIAPDCEGPSGLAIDLANRRLFAGCNNQKMSVLDADRGTIIQTLPIGVHIDAVAYDPSTKLIFNANRSSVTIIHPQKYREASWLSFTAPNSKTGAPTYLISICAFPINNN